MASFRNQISRSAPHSAKLTPYDEEHVPTYMRLLDAVAAGASDDEMMRIILELNPVDPRAPEILHSHIHRAQWMARLRHRDGLSTR